MTPPFVLLPRMSPTGLTGRRRLYLNMEQVEASAEGSQQLSKASPPPNTSCRHTDSCSTAIISRISERSFMIAFLRRDRGLHWR